MELTIGLAFVAGLVSFISPCVLPLVPAYVGYMGGRVTNTVASSVRSEVEGAANQRRARFGTAVHGVFFVAGFTLVFVAIGLASTAFIQQIGGSNVSHVTDIIGRVGGVIIVFFGLHFMGLLPRVFAWLRARERVLGNVLFSLGIALAASVLITWGFTGAVRIWATPLWDTNVWIPTAAAVLLVVLWVGLLFRGAFTAPGTFWNGVITRVETALYSDTRREMTAKTNQGLGGSFVMGIVFSAGWTPCIGPVYGAVLTLAASGGDVGEAGSMLTAYSLGLGVPFLLTALMLDSAQGTLRRLQRHMRTIEYASGTFLIVIGLAVASGYLQDLSQRFSGEFAEFSVGVEEAALDFVTGGDDDESESLIVAAPAEASEDSATDDATTNVSGGADSAEMDQIAASNNAPEAEAALENVEVGLAIGNRAPDFQTVTETGEPIALSDLRGQVVLLNFWATWCGPCRVEMPEFQAFFEEHQADGFTILAVNNSETVGDVEGFRDELGLTFPLAMDERGEIQAEYGVFSYPSTLVLDRNGVIVARHFGLLDGSQLDDLVNQALVF
ncbi:MAG: redoxin domain-containing protein [Chloroflexi bacterium]|nr:redoxin domain-containing protein [Chloroflexota bacterium]